MKFNYLKCVLVTSSALTLCVSAQAMAQEAEQAARATDSGEIVVTARRVEENLQDVPISMTVFNQAQIDNRNIDRAAPAATRGPSCRYRTG